MPVYITNIMMFSVGTCMGCCCAVCCIATRRLKSFRLRQLSIACFACTATSSPETVDFDPLFTAKLRFSQLWQALSKQSFGLEKQAVPCFVKHMQSARHVPTCTSNSGLVTMGSKLLFSSSSLHPTTSWTGFALPPLSYCLMVLLEIPCCTQLPLVLFEIPKCCRLQCDFAACSCDCRLR